MEATKTSYESLSLSVPALTSLVSDLMGGTIGYPDPDNPTPPGPWDPYIRKALIRLMLTIGPVPDPWGDLIGGPSPQPWQRMSLNPHPLLAKASFAAFIAQEVIDRALLVQEVADAIGVPGQSQGIVIALGIVSRFIDDCGNDKLWAKRPLPPPKNDSDNRLTALELLVMATQFDRSASGTADAQLREELRNAGSRLTRMGVARIEAF